MSKSMFDKMRVHMWISGTTDDEGNGGWCCYLQSIIDGKTYSKTIGGYGKNTTITRMSLVALLNGLLSLNPSKPIFLNIYTSVYQVSTGLNRNMYMWAKNDWKTTKKENPKHLDLWKQIYEILTSKERTIAYRVIRTNIEQDTQPQRVFAINESAKYVLTSKQDLYEVRLA